MTDDTTQPEPAATPRRARRPRLGRTAALWLLSVGLLLAAVGLDLTVLHGVPAPEGGLRLSWWMLAPFFLVGELCAVHVHLRRSAHTLTLSELPLVAGLLLASPSDLLLGQLLGAGAVLVWTMRGTPVRLAFNLGQLLFVSAVAATVFSTLAAGGPTEPLTWLACTIAVLIGGALSVLLIAGAIQLAEGSFDRNRLVGMLGTAAAVSATNAALALAGVVVAAQNILAFGLLLVPTGTVFFAYRAYLSARGQHQRLEFLHAATKALAHAPETAVALGEVLDRTVEMFRAEWAEVMLLPMHDGDEPLVLQRGGRRTDGLEALAPPIARALQRIVGDDHRPRPIEPDRLRGALGRRLVGQGVESALIAPLPGETRLMGTIMLANRTGAGTPYTDEEHRLFETLARQAGTWLEQDRLERTVWRLRELQEQLEHQAFHDPLTGLANRARFADRVDAALVSKDAAVAVLFLDLDGFKSINDTLGHTAGDALLSGVAERLRGALPPAGLAARLGGDEFAVLLTGPEAMNAQLAAERLLAGLTQPLRVEAQELRVRGSIGVAIADDDDDTDELLRKADVAMYAAKARGRGQVATYDPALHDEVVRRHALASDLERALARSEFKVHFQPIVDLESGAVVAAEALVRWESPLRGMVPPDQFIACAEETGLIVQIGRFVLDDACRQLGALEQALGVPDLALHVNLSALEFGQNDLVEQVADVLWRRRVPAGRLVLEVTETAVMHTGGDAADRLRRLRELGVRLALDDFGTGWSSLGSLRTLPLDMVKIAKPFIDDLAHDAEGEAFVKMMLDLFGTLRLPVVAEGIEHEEQALVLRGLQCAMGQGFHFARPAPAPSLGLERSVARAA